MPFTREFSDSAQLKKRNTRPIYNNLPHHYHLQRHSNLRSSVDILVFYETLTALLAAERPRKAHMATGKKRIFDIESLSTLQCQRQRHDKADK
jgi:hypothetical protein